MADLDALRTFLAVVRTGSFAAASRQLNLSPAMVGRRIQALEQRYRTRLIERTTRSQRLTEHGQQFLLRAEAALEAIAMLDDFPASGELAGRIRLSAPVTLGTRLLPSAVAGFTAEHPRVHLEMLLSDRRVDLVREGFDLAVRVGHLPSSSMVARRIGTYRFVCCAAPAFVARHGMPGHPSELADARCVLNLNLLPRDRWTFHDEAGTALAVHVGGTVEIDNGEAQRAIAISGGGIIYAPLDLVRDDLAEHRLVQILPAWTLPTLPIHVVYPSRRLLPRAVAALVGTLVATFGETPG